MSVTLVPAALPPGAPPPAPPPGRLGIAAVRVGDAAHAVVTLIGDGLTIAAELELAELVALIDAARAAAATIVAATAGGTVVPFVPRVR